MLKKTHLAVGLAVGLYFLPFVTDKVLFIPVILIASLLPDIDSGFSQLGRKKIFKPIQWTVSHRGIIHSYTLCIALSLVLAFFYPVLALPFFLGYSFHLLLDSFTVNGIKPFWPLKFKSSGKIRSGGRVESGIFITFVVLGILFFSRLFL